MILYDDDDGDDGRTTMMVIMTTTMTEMVAIMTVRVLMVDLRYNEEGHDHDANDDDAGDDAYDVEAENGNGGNDGNDDFKYVCFQMCGCVCVFVWRSPCYSSTQGNLHTCFHY